MREKDLNKEFLNVQLTVWEQTFLLLYVVYFSRQLKENIGTCVDFTGKLDSILLALDKNSKDKHFRVNKFLSGQDHIYLHHWYLIKEALQTYLFMMCLQ